MFGSTEKSFDTSLLLTDPEDSWVKRIASASARFESMTRPAYHVRLTKVSLDDRHFSITWFSPSGCSSIVSVIKI